MSRLYLAGPDAAPRLCSALPAAGRKSCEAAAGFLLEIWGIFLFWRRRRGCSGQLPTAAADSAANWTHCCTALHLTALYCTSLHCTILQYTALQSAALCNAALHCTVLYCTGLKCIMLHCNALYFTQCFTVQCVTLDYTALRDAAITNYSPERRSLVSSGVNWRYLTTSYS